MVRVISYFLSSFFYVIVFYMEMSPGATFIAKFTMFDEGTFTSNMTHLQTHALLV